MEFLANKFGYDGNAQMLRRDFIRYYGTTPAANLQNKKKWKKPRDCWLRQHTSMKEIAVKLKYKSHTTFWYGFQK